MPDYVAPVRDSEFVALEVLDFEAHYQAVRGNSDVDRDLIRAIISGFAQFAEHSVAPLASSADVCGSTCVDGIVKTPSGYKESYQEFARDGWRGLAAHTDHGGQGLPKSLATVIGEYSGSADMAWHLFQVACEGAIETLQKHGTEEQQDRFLRPLVAGEWFATMALTEPQCGSDLAQVNTIATPQVDGSYRVSGTKIFISCGDHDLASNIIHIVLARTPDAPAGTAGLSLFIVPKCDVDISSGALTPNGVVCPRIEEKMGLHGSPTCELLFDDAKGYPLGPINSGLKTMFTFMNDARLATANQSLSHMEYGLQQSLAYSRERRSMRAPGGPVEPQKSADPIHFHPDVRRMLMTQKALTEGGRIFVYWVAQLVDMDHAVDSEVSADVDLLSLLTPIAKGFLSEVSQECCYLSVQCFGGHGYVRDWGVERNTRDARISTIWEGTTGIQALDLLGRKVLGSTVGEQRLVEVMRDHITVAKSLPNCGWMSSALDETLTRWRSLIEEVRSVAAAEPERVGSASYPFLMYSGYLVLGYCWLKAATVAERTLAECDDKFTLYESKIATAEFYFTHLLPRCEAFTAGITAHSDSTMKLSSEQLGP